MQLSATLKAGQATGSMKSTTAPSRARSMRLPAAPPTSIPTGQPQQRQLAIDHEVADQEGQREADEDRHGEPGSLERAERHARVADVAQLEAREEVHVLAREHLVLDERLGDLVERHHHARGHEGAQRRTHDLSRGSG